jgi:hypothetical protein
VRLGGYEPGQVVGEGGVAAAGPAELGAGARVDLPVDRVVRLAGDGLAGGKAKGLGSGSPPAAGWFPGLGGVEVVAAGGQLAEYWANADSLLFFQQLGVREVHARG